MNSSSANAVMQYQQEQQVYAPADVACLAFSQNGTLIACGASNLVRVWRTSNGREMYNFVAESNAISVLWGDEQTLYCGFLSGDVLVKVFDESKQEVRILGFQASTKPVAYIALDNSGTKIAFGGGDEVTIWVLRDDEAAPDGSPIPEWTFVKKLPSPPEQPWPLEITSIAWSNGEPSTLVVSYLRHGVVTWNTETSKRVSGITLGLISQGSLSPDGRHFVVSTDKQTFDLYTVGTSMHQRTFADKDLPSCPLQTNPVMFVHRGEWLLGGGIGKATLWHVGTGGQFQSMNIAGPGPASPVTSLAACESKDESGVVCFQIATVINSREVIIWKAHPLLARQLSEHENVLPNSVNLQELRIPSNHGGTLTTNVSYPEWFVILGLTIMGIAYFNYE